MAPVTQLRHIPTKPDHEALNPALLLGAIFFPLEAVALFRCGDEASFVERPDEITIDDLKTTPSTMPFTKRMIGSGELAIRSLRVQILTP